MKSRSFHFKVILLLLLLLLILNHPMRRCAGYCVVSTVKCSVTLQATVSQQTVGPFRFPHFVGLTDMF